MASLRTTLTWENIWAISLIIISVSPKKKKYGTSWAWTQQWILPRNIFPRGYKQKCGGLHRVRMRRFICRNIYVNVPSHTRRQGYHSWRIMQLVIRCTSPNWLLCLSCTGNYSYVLRFYFTILWHHKFRQMTNICRKHAVANNSEFCVAALCAVHRSTKSVLMFDELSTELRNVQSQCVFRSARKL